MRFVKNYDTPSAATLTDDLHFVCGVDFSGPIGHFAGVSAALLRAEVPQAQGPLLLTALAHLLLRQQPIVLQPLDFRAGVPAGHALEPDGAADGTGDHPLPHLGGMSEARTCCGETWRRLMLQLDEAPMFQFVVVLIRRCHTRACSPNLLQITNPRTLNWFPGKLPTETH